MERVTVRIYSQFTIKSFLWKTLFLLAARQSLQAASPHCFVRRLILLWSLFLLAARHSANKFALCSRSAASVHNLKRLFSLVFEGLWLSVRIAQKGKSALGNLFTNHFFSIGRYRLLRLKVRFSFRGVVTIREDSAKWKEWPWKFTYKRSLFSFCVIVADNQTLAIKRNKTSRQNQTRNKNKNSYVVKLPETEFRLKGFGHLFSKRCEKKKL